MGEVHSELVPAIPDSVSSRPSLPVNMSAFRLSRAALRARSTVVLKPIQRRGYAEAVSDKIKLSLALPHQSIYKSQDVYVLSWLRQNPNVI